MLNQRHLRYQTDIPYFSGAEEGKARLLVELNQEFVFGRLNQIAVIFAITLFVVLAVFALGAFMAVRRWIILPLEEITLFSRNQQESNGTYFIEEISSLKQTPAQMAQQQNNKPRRSLELLGKTKSITIFGKHVGGRT